MLAADDPNWADIVAALGQVGGAVATTAAVAFAFWVAQRDRRWRREEQAVQGAERADREAAQARTMTVSVRENPQRVGQPVTLLVEIRNAGPRLPMFDVTIIDVEGEEIEQGHRLGTPPGHGDPYATEDVLNAGHAVARTLGPLDRPSRGTLPVGDIVTVAYRDADGVRWTRRNHERPIRVIDQPPPTPQPGRFRLRLPWTWG